MEYVICESLYNSDSHITYFISHNNECVKLATEFQSDNPEIFISLITIMDNV